MEHANSQYAGPIERLCAALGRRAEPGDIGLVMARAGVGKSTLLVQMGLGELLAGREIMHIAAGQTVEQIEARYDALFRDLADAIGLADPRGDRVELARRRAIQAHGHVLLTAGRVWEAAATFRKHLGLAPTLVLLDGYDWEADGASDRVALSDFRELGRELGASLWLTARTSRDQQGAHLTAVPPPLADLEELMDQVLFLEPEEHRINVRVLRFYDQAPPAEPVLELAPGTLRPEIAPVQGHAAQRALPGLFTLLSGAARGAEAEFGECAERWGVNERNFSFKDRPVERTRGLVLLEPDELKQGAVSWKYITSQLHRDFRQTEAFRKVLYSIWHQVNPAGEVFSVGEIRANNTVKGGTGWAVELARHWKKPVFVFDQERLGWFTWDGAAWQPVEPPRITHRRFAGTGTRSLDEPGRQAIRELFERTFG